MNDYITAKAQIAGVPITKKQAKQFEALKKKFKANLASMMQEGGGKTKKKRNIGKEQSKRLKDRGQAVSLLMKVKGYSLGKASKRVAELHDQGVGYSEMIDALK